MGLINRAFRDYERASFGKLKGAEREKSRDGFHAGVLTTLRMLTGVSSEEEGETMWSQLVRELAEWGDTLPCTCGQCKPGGFGLHPPRINNSE